MIWRMSGLTSLFGTDSFEIRAVRGEPALPGASPTARRGPPLTGGGSRPRPRILLADPDPYLAFLLELNVPGAAVHTADPDEPEELLPADLVIVDVERPTAARYIGNSRGAHILAMVERARLPASIPAGVDALLVRPFFPVELADAVRDALTRPATPPQAARHRRSRVLAGIAGGMLALGAAVVSLELAPVPDLPAAWTLPAIPAAGLLARAWVRFRMRRERRDPLGEANRLLWRLHRLAREAPGALELGGVAEAAMDEAKESMGAIAGAVIISDAGWTRVTSSFGLPGADALNADARAATLPALAARYDGSPGPAPGTRWHAELLPPRGRHAHGALLVALPADSERSMSRRLASETALALENARLFRRIREMSVDDERRRLAGELHDGVAQSLAHLRLELGFLARHGSDGLEAMQREAGRLSHVVDGALGDIRATMAALRSSVASDGLAGSLRAYARDLSALAEPPVRMEVRRTPHVAPDLGAEIFRIVQAALSALLPGARQVRLVLDAAEGTTLVSIRAATGAEGRTPRDLGAIARRAASVGGRMSVRTEEDGVAVDLSFSDRGELP